jgi:hypothetical protein
MVAVEPPLREASVRHSDRRVVDRPDLAGGHHVTQPPEGIGIAQEELGVVSRASVRPESALQNQGAPERSKPAVDHSS